MKLSKTWLWVIFSILILYPPLVLTRSGFCYSEMRWLNERELVDRMLFGEKEFEMSFAEKVTFIREKNSGEYPNNCKINGEPFDLSEGSKLINGLFGLMFYKVDCVYLKEDRKGEENPYYIEWVSVSSCGQDVDSMGESITESSYQSYIRKNSNYWKEIEE